MFGLHFVLLMSPGTLGHFSCYLILHFGLHRIISKINQMGSDVIVEEEWAHIRCLLEYSSEVTKATHVSGAHYV